ncbi:MAG: hypothetical protein MK185_09740 [Saccharospirillaceae bacterium]|nr:hypothetical protein [Saccharospirillaceae bacterium]
MNKKSFCIANFVLATALLSACGSDDNNSSSNANNNQSQVDSPVFATSSCFWQGPYSIENPKSNFAYPDTGATYWSSRYKLPQGATLKLKGDFPFARYMSLNSYNSAAAPMDAISDSSIIANQGAINPFVNGNQRDAEQRGYQLTIAAGSPPPERATNTLYDHTTDDQAVLLYRVYVPDNGKSMTGGVKLPEPEVTLANSGETLTGQALCDELDNDPNLLQIPLVPAGQYAARKFNPAKEIPVWQAAYNFTYSVACNFFGGCYGVPGVAKPERQVGWFANLDNQYMSSFIDRSIKPIAVIRGKIPAVPQTLEGTDTFDTDDAQLRYWSICQNEYYSQKVTQCLYDEQITINPDGKFTIVTSWEQDRPENATKECGIEYLKWSESGDGFSLIPGKQNSINDGLLIIRNMLPMNGFNKTVQQTATPGDEAQVMAEFLPEVTYYTQQEFEALGCDAYNSL